MALAAEARAAIGRLLEVDRRYAGELCGEQEWRHGGLD